MTEQEARRHYDPKGRAVRREDIQNPSHWLPADRDG